MLNGDGINENEMLNDKDHCHSKATPYLKPYKARNKLVVACIICLVFTIVEVLGGYMADSLAILTDAAHLLTDFGSFGISLFSLYMSWRPATKKFTFGWHRAEVLGALVSILLIWVLTGLLIYYAVQRVLTPDYDINASIMLITAAFGVIVNVIMGLTLHPPHHRCSSGHAHIQGGGEQVAPHTDDSHVTISSGSTGSCPRVRTESTSSRTGLLAPLLSSSVSAIVTPAPPTPSGSCHGSSSASSISSSSSSIAIRAAYIHVLGDLVQSCGILIASFLIYYRPDWKIADPLCTFLFSVLVLLTTFPILRDIIYIMMERMPKDINYQEFKGALNSIPGVLNVHDIRVWSLTMEKRVASFHLSIAPQVSYRDVTKCADQLVRERFRIYQVTIQIEEHDEDMLTCPSCNDPKN